jgi:hypothetical protein
MSILEMLKRNKENEQKALAFDELLADMYKTQLASTAYNHGKSVVVPTNIDVENGLASSISPSYKNTLRSTLGFDQAQIPEPKGKIGYPQDLGLSYDQASDMSDYYNHEGAYRQ